VPLDRIAESMTSRTTLVAVSAVQSMAAARITGSARAGRLRLSFHVSTSDEDADLAANVLRRHVISRRSARP
jgi:cysteine sulfinate desulfinase/cysteine desulfurase-like protein